MNALTQRHRAQQLLLARSTTAQIERLWPALKWDQLDETYPRFAVAAAAAVSKNRQTSIGAASQYLQAFRRDEGVRKTLRVVLPDALEAEHLNASLHATSVAPLKTAAAKDVAPDVALSNALRLVQGSAMRLVLGGGRETVRRTTVADSVAVGWVRVGEGGCDWCAQYLDGEVRTVEGYDFAAHDWCKCTAEPVYRT